MLEDCPDGSSDPRHCVGGPGRNGYCPDFISSLPGSSFEITEQCSLLCVASNLGPEKANKNQAREK